MTNYAIRKQKFCLKRDKSLRMGFCRKDPPIEDVFVSYKLDKKKKKRNKLRFPPPPTPPPEIKEEPAATSLSGFSPTRPEEREREPGNGVEAAEDVLFIIHHFGRASY